MSLFHISGDVLVVRIPELPANTTLANEDQIPIWHAATNITEKTSLTTLRSFIETGSGGTLDPVYSGGTILYIVPAGDEGLTAKSFPQIAGMEFKLTRDGYPMKPIDEFIRLDAGGFGLVGTTLIEGQRYELDVFQLTSGLPASGGSGSGFIAGNKIVNTNEVVSISDLNKVLQVRGASTALTITLPDVNLCPANSFVIIETLINNTKQHRIITTSSQYIYQDNVADLEFFIGVGEYIWFYRTDDGWYILVGKGNLNLGVPTPAYKAGLNQVGLTGQLLSRTDYPRLWKFVQTLGASLVSDGTWNTASASVAGRTVNAPYRGCFSTGDGSTTFRLPDYRGMSVRGLFNPGGSDADRHFNTPGGYQRHELESHVHSLSHGRVGGVDGTIGGGWGDVGTNNTIEGGLVLQTGGSESRMDNIGLQWFINY